MRVSRRYLLWAAPAVVACLIAISFFAFGEPRSHEMQAIENPSDAADAAKASGYDDINFWTGEPIWTSTFGIPEQPDWTPIQQTAADNEDAVDRAVAEHAKQAKATVQVATAMLLGKTYEARLIVEHGSGAATLEIARESRASIVVDKLDISVTGEVMAKVSSPSFDVLPTSPETLTLAQDKVGVWTWNVVPKEEGEVNLTFNLYNIVSFDLIQHSSPVKRFPAGRDGQRRLAGRGSGIFCRTGGFLLKRSGCRAVSDCRVCCERGRLWLGAFPTTAPGGRSARAASRGRRRRRGGHNVRLTRVYALSRTFSES